MNQWEMGRLISINLNHGISSKFLFEVHDSQFEFEKSSVKGEKDGFASFQHDEQKDGRVQAIER